MLRLEPWKDPMLVREAPVLRELPAPPLRELLPWGVAMFLVLVLLGVVLVFLTPVLGWKSTATPWGPVPLLSSATCASSTGLYFCTG